MKPERFATITDVHLLFVREGDGAPEILLGRRQGTGYADGQWHMPSGHLEEGESATAGAAREGGEEVGTTVDPADLDLVHILHRGHPTEAPRFGLAFLVRKWDGEPFNAEPDKCAEIRWFRLDELPVDMVPYPRAVLDNYIAGVPYAEVGW